MPLNPYKLRLAAHLILWVLGFSYNANGAPTKGRLEDPVKVNAKTELVINSALSYLASKQSPSGAWAGETGEEARYPIAMTAYTLMAFQAAGNLPNEGPYGKNVDQAVRYLLSQINDQGLIGDANSGKYMYFLSLKHISEPTRQAESS